VAVLKIEEVASGAKGAADVGVLKVQGEVDLDTVKQLADKLTEVVEKRGLHRLVLDMAETDYVNSTALATLVKFSEKCRERGGGIALANTVPRVKLVFEMLGLLYFFKFFDSVEKAKAGFQAGKK
jgi:anti-anti-sigma factor